MTSVSPVTLADACHALGEVAPRLASLFRAVRTPEALALDDWTVADVAAHLSHAYGVLVGLATGEGDPFLDDVWELSERTRAWVDDDGERDLDVLAGRIEAGAATFLARVGDGTTDGSRPWIVRGLTASPTTFACHLLNESLVHGFDIARAARLPWPIERDHARIVFLGFIVPLFQTLEPTTLVHPEKGARFRAVYDLRFRGGGQAHFVFRDGGVQVEEPSRRRVDCHVSADPSALLLVAWGRRSQWRAIFSGKLFAWGRRPWLGPRLRAVLRNT